MYFIELIAIHCLLFLSFKCSVSDVKIGNCNVSKSFVSVPLNASGGLYFSSLISLIVALMKTV